MLYEIVIAHGADKTDDIVNKTLASVKKAITDTSGEILVEDSWGRVRFAQATSDGKDTARMDYLIYSCDGTANLEINRVLRINEHILKSMIVKLHKNTTSEDAVKNYRSPYSTSKKGSVVDDFEEKGSDLHKDRRKFSKRKTCWYTAKNVRADWKDPNTYSWLVNEFGKISAKRVSGISRKHQRWATTAIKQARTMGLISHTSGRTAQAAH
jgi:small subunit ribosomal protein S6